MRLIPLLGLIGLTASGAAWAQTDANGTLEKPVEPLLTVAKPSAADAKGSSANAPVLQAITYRTHVPLPNGMTIDIVPDFHFMAPKGNAVVLRRELVDTNGAFAQVQIRNATINIPAAAQEMGTVLTGGWRCGPSIYYVTLKAFLLDADGDRSNALTYTIHCNGG